MHKSIVMGKKDYTDLSATENRCQQIPLDSTKETKNSSVFTSSQRDKIEEHSKLSNPIVKLVKTKIQGTNSRVYVQIKVDNIGNILTSILNIITQEERVLQKHNRINRVIGVEINEDIDEIRVLCSTNILAIRISSKLKDS